MKKNLFMVIVLREHDEAELITEATVALLREPHFLKYGEDVEAVTTHNTVLLCRSFPCLGFRR